MLGHGAAAAAARAPLRKESMACVAGEAVGGFVRTGPRKEICKPEKHSLFVLRIRKQGQTAIQQKNGFDMWKLYITSAQLFKFHHNFELCKFR
jgi:hypothetical protein